MTQAALRHLFEARRFGSSRREPATGELGFFGDGAWCSNGATIESDGSFQELYEKQFGAPVFQRTGIGAPEFASASWDTPSILSAVADVYKAFCFGDEGATQFRTPEERYQFLSEDGRVCSFLACAKFIRGADPVTREPIFGEPVLTVIHAPDVALAGKSISGEEVWPGVDSLSPIGWRCPNGPLYPFAGSVAASSREFSERETMQCTRSTYLESVVLGFEDLSSYSLGWTTYEGQISPRSRPFVTTDLSAIPDTILAQFFGAQRPTEFSGNMSGVYIPKLFPLPARSGLAASQLYDPTLGASGFVNAILEQASGASPEVCTCLQWMSAFQPMRAFLDAVKEDPAAFAIPLVARASILDCLRADFAAQPSVTKSSLAPLSWAINTTVWRMHCDNIRATRRETVVASYDLYLSRAAASMKRAAEGDNPFGNSPPALNPVLPVLRPPRHKNWSEGKFRLQVYSDETCAPPLAADFRMVKVATSQSAWQAPLLETHEEFEDQLALQNPSPDSARLHHRMQNPRTTSGLDNPNVNRNRFPPAAGNSRTAQFQQFHTGTPPGYATTVSVQPVMNSQQRE
jgi:hypothetical protein